MQHVHRSQAIGADLLFIPDEAPLRRLVGLLGSPRPGRVVMVRSADDNDRSYLLRAAEYACEQAGTPLRIVGLSLDGYEPRRGTGGIQAFAEYALPQPSPQDPQGSESPRRWLRSWLEADAQAPAEAFPTLALLLGIARHLEPAELDALGEEPAPGPGQPAQAAFDRLLQALAADTQLLLVVSEDDTVLSDPLCKALLDHAAGHPDVTVVLGCGLHTAPDLVAQRGLREPLLIDLSPLTQTQLEATLIKAHNGDLPPTLVHALWNDTHGHPGRLDQRVTRLAQRGLLEFPDGGGFRVAAGELSFTDETADSPSLARWLLDQGEDAEALRGFLLYGALCGQHFPGELLWQSLRFPDEVTARLSQTIDRDLVNASPPVESRPRLRRSDAGHPGLPSGPLYVFCDPDQRQAILQTHEDLRGPANDLLAFLMQRLGGATRASTQLLRNVAQHCDEDQARDMELRLRLWIGPEHAGVLQRILADDIRAGHQDPERLWQHAKQETTGPPYQRLALLDAYGDMPGGVPADRNARFRLLRAQVLHESGRVDEAVALVTEAMAELPEGQQHRLRWDALHLWGCCHQARGEFEQAITRFLEAAEAATAEDSPGNEARGLTLHELGRCYQELADIPRAVACFEQSIEAHRRGDALGRIDHRSIGIALYELGQCPVEGREPSQEVACFEEAIAEHRKGNELGRVDHESIGIAVHEMGRRHRKQRDFTRAIACFEQALQEARKGDAFGRVDYHGIGMTLHEMGRCYQEQRELDRALRAFEQALRSKRQGDALGRVDHRSIGMTWHAMGQCRQEQRDLDAALTCFDRAITEIGLGDALGRIDHHSIGGASYQMGRCHQERADPDRARACFERAIQELERGDVFGGVDDEAAAAVRKAADECLEAN